MSGVGKGISASSIAKILQFNNQKVTSIKIDPYVNVDAGTMNPTEHGEVFVLDDGYECDQDMGNYERFLNKSLSKDSYITTGSIYLKVIQKERSLEYQGKCVDVVPDIPLEIISQIKKAAKKEKADIVIIEIGGTLGEYQNILFIEALRILKIQEPENVISILVSYLPTPNKVGEMKTKPTQNAIKTMRETGTNPDFIIGRSEFAIDKKRKGKLAFYSGLKEEDIISAIDVDSIYDVPENFLNQKLDKLILKKLNIKNFKENKKEITKWKDFIKNKNNPKNSVKIAVIGKYFSTGDYVLSDAYISIIEALKFSGIKEKISVKLDWIDSRDFEHKNYKEELNKLLNYDGILIPGGFGKTGIEGKIKAIEFIRKNKIPFFGICYGMQLASIEYARNVCNIKNATSYEIDNQSKFKVIDILPEQLKLLKKGNFGGSMRLGAYDAVIEKNTLAYSIYKKQNISERHRHRYELSSKYIPILEKNGLIISAFSKEKKLPEIIELPKDIHPFFIATQFHPEMKARPLNPHPIFTAFVKASLKNKLKKK